MGAMPILQVGNTAIPYTVTQSLRARRHRVIITAGVVEVIAPVGADEAQTRAFLHGRRRWVFDTRARMLERVSDCPHPQRYVSGAKVPYRGRQVRLWVQVGECADANVMYRNGFYVMVPESTNPTEHDAQVEAALDDWMKTRLRHDVAILIERYCSRLGVEAKGFRLRDQKHLWGSCGRDGTIYLNWHLIFVPQTVLEYAVLHEVCHLRHRNHSPSFWALVRTAMPDFEPRKALLDRQTLSESLKQANTRYP